MDIVLILRTIAAIVRRPPHRIAFYELSTPTSWRCPAGTYEFQRVYCNNLLMSDDADGIQWKTRPCPPTVLELFRHQIGGHPMPSQGQHPTWKRLQGQAN